MEFDAVEFGTAPFMIHFPFYDEWKKKGGSLEAFDFYGSGCLYKCIKCSIKVSEIIKCVGIWPTASALSILNFI